MAEELPWGALLMQLDPREQRKALRGAMRRVGNMVRKKAVTALRASGLKTNKQVEKGVRVEVYTKALGFKVTTKPKKWKGQRVREKDGKPIAMWAAEGTELRKTKTQTKFFIRKKKGHNTGRMPAYHFMDEAERALDSAENMALQELDRNITKVARKF